MNYEEEEKGRGTQSSRKCTLCIPLQEYTDWSQRNLPLRSHLDSNTSRGGGELV